MDRRKNFMINKIGKIQEKGTTAVSYSVEVNSVRLGVPKDKEAPQETREAKPSGQNADRPPLLQ